MSKAVPLPLGKPVQYKYVVCDGASSGGVHWELREENRHLVPTGRRQVVEDDNGKYRHLTPQTWNPEPSETAEQETCDVQDSSANAGASSPGRMPKIESFTRRLKREEELQVTSSDDVFVVFRSLPVRLERDGNGNWTVEENVLAFKVVSFLQQSLQSNSSEEGQRSFSIKFVGDPGVRTTDPDERQRITDVLARHCCIPVFVDQQIAEQHLEFCHLFLWPVMHNMKVFEDEETQQEGQTSRQKFDEATWKHYQVFNRTYAEVVEASLQPHTMIWVHDFYLLLVPRYLHLRRPDATVGFFLHSAFPSSEVLRCIPMREEILQSLLSCRVVAFQTFEYARHFLSGCQFLLSATQAFRPGGVLCVEHEGRSVVLRADHFVLPFADFVARLAGEGVRARAGELRRQFGGRLVFASVDGDEPFSGLVLKLRAFHRFLKECPQHLHQVVLLQHVLARRVGAESEILHEIKRMAEETNQAFGQELPLVVIAEGDLSVDGRLAVLQAADVLLDTSINDGLNLNPFVYCCAHTDDMTGSMIVSEFSGCSSFLTGAIKVNPWDTQAVVNAMHTVITMEESEREVRFRRDHSYVATQSLDKWLDQNLSELKRAREEKEDGPLSGLGAGSRLLFMERGFRHLSLEAVLCDYRAARARAIFLDIEGTLAPDHRSVLRPYSAQEQVTREARPLDPQVLDSLRLLANDRANVVTVISGRERAVLDHWFVGVEGLGLCAEHGFDWVLPGRLQPRGPMQAGAPPPERWQCMLAREEEEDDWKPIAFELMKQYAKRVQGSVAEYKGSAITWNYRKVGAQALCEEMARELMRFLNPDAGPDSLMHGYPIRVVHGKGYVEVKRSDVDKGVAVSRVLREMQGQLGQIDFILCIGDDRSDEDMFEVVNAFGRGALSEVDDDACSSNPASPFRRRPAPSESSIQSSRMTHRSNCSMTFEEFNPASCENRSKFYSVTVGRKPSKAGYFVKDVGEVSELLQKLASQAIVTNLSRFMSMPALARTEDSGDSEEDT